MPARAEIDTALKLVEADLARYHARWATVQAVMNEPLSREFPHHVFFSVVFRQYPLGRNVPAPYQPADIYAVTRGKSPRLLLLT
jgi:hypothetical protein